MTDFQFELGLVIGRFQHIHNGHTKMIDTALNACEQVLLMVGSSQESMTERNPFTLKTRMDLIRKVYKKEISEGRLLLCHIDDLTDETDDSFSWGDFVFSKIDMWCQHYAISKDVDCLIYGSDKNVLKWYRPELLKNVSHIILNRKDDDISATELREKLSYSFSAGYMIDSWVKHVPFAIRDEYHRLKREMKYVNKTKEQEQQEVE